MNEDTKAKMIDKVKKLLALAGSSNEHEAALAAERAQAILAQYNLSMSDIRETNTSEDDVDMAVAASTDAKPWRRPLAQAVGQLYFCNYFYRRFNSKLEQHTFVGSMANIAVATLMFEYLQTTVDTLAKKGALSVPPNQRVRYRIAFRKACVLRLCTRIRKRIEAAKAGEVKTEGGTNLPALLSLYEKWNGANKAFIDENIGKMKEIPMNTKSSHAWGTIDGQAAGERIGLDQQVNKGKTTQIGR